MADLRIGGRSDDTQSARRAQSKGLCLGLGVRARTHFRRSRPFFVFLLQFSVRHIWMILSAAFSGRGKGRIIPHHLRALDWDRVAESKYHAVSLGSQQKFSSPHKLTRARSSRAGGLPRP